MPGGTWRLSGSHPGGAARGGRPAADGARQTSTEDVRRAVALAMSVLENTGVQALGHVAVSGPPARAVARMARARGVRAIVLDQAPADGLTSDLRRRVHGSGIVVVSATERGGRLAPIVTASRADLIVVGAGLAGSAAAWAASGRGMSVIVLEAFAPGHRHGSSHGSARIYRRAYPDALYVQLTGRAGELWRQLEDEAGESLLQLTGGLDFGPRRDPERLHAVLASCGVPPAMSPAQAAERWPGICFDGGGPVMHHADAGVLDPDRATAAMLRLAAAALTSVSARRSAICR